MSEKELVPLPSPITITKGEGGEEKKPSVVDDIVERSKQMEQERAEGVETGANKNEIPFHCFAGPENCEGCRKEFEAAPEPQKEERRVLERIRKTQRIFVEKYIQFKGRVQRTCDVVGIGRTTWWRWLDDPVFKDQIELAQAAIREDVESKLMERIENDSPSCIRYWLDRRHPKYKPKSKVDMTSGGKPLATGNQITLVRYSEEKKEEQKKP